tara:strand:+ start:4458 stop:6608 length:2151 start_codon:yes stop_codon:yes gene_type:complete
MATQNIEIRVLDKTSQALGNISGRLKKLNTGLLGVSRVAGLAGAAIAGIFGGSVIRSIVNTSARFEDLRTSLSSVTGSAKQGADAFDFIAKFSTKTQFGIEELSETFIKLKAAGIEPTEELLTTFTDTAAVTTDQLGSLQAITDLFSRTVSGGLGLEELNRLADRGVPVFRILEEQLGITRLEISKFGQTAEGAEKIRTALQKGVNELFGGATAARAQNLSTQISNLQIAFKNAQDAVGRQGFALALGEVTTAITESIVNSEDLQKTIGVGVTKAFLGLVAVGKFVIANIGLIGKAFATFIGLKIALSVGSIALAFGSTLVKGLALAAAGFRKLTVVMLRNPIIALGVGLAAIIEKTTGAFSKLADKLGIKELAGEGFDKLLDGAKGLKDEIIGSDGIVKGLGELVNDFDNLNGEADRLNKKAQGYNAELEKQQQQLETNNETQKTANKLSKEQVAAAKELQSVLGNLSIPGGLFEGFDPIQSQIDKQKEILKKARDEERITERQHQAALEKIELDGRRSRQKKLEDQIQSTVELIKSGKAEEADITVLGEKNKNKLLAALGKDFLNTLAQTNEKAFRIAKAIAITETIINTARGIVKALGQGGIFGFASAAVIAATGAAQLAQIKSTQYTGPREKGGQVTTGRSFLVGEKGPELFTPDAGGRITPNNELGNVNISFTINAIDSRDIDTVLIERKQTIIGVINEALNRKGKVGVTN